MKKCLLASLTLAAAVLGLSIFAGASVGQVDDPKVQQVPQDAIRYYYAGPDLASSVRTNALGDDQVLYYDVYPPTAPDLRVVAIYIHGGGYNVGYANNGGLEVNIDQLRAMGFWCVSPEYRRGWQGDGSGGASEADLTPAEAALFLEAVDLATEDVLDAWHHLHTVVRKDLGLGFRYMVAGESAGGSLASRITLTNPNLNRQVVGAIIGFGTHSDQEPTVNHGFPVVIQGGLFDPIQPAYSNHQWFDADMPVGKGLFELYDELSQQGQPARLLISAQKGHGFGAYKNADGSAAHYAEAVQFFKDVYRGASPPNYIEYKFSRNDPLYPGISPGDRVNDWDNPGFRYDPYQTDFENGLSPDQVIAIYGL